MTAAFIVHIEVDFLDPESLALDAQDMMDELDDSEFNVISVAPYARHDAGVNMALVPNQLPPSGG